jgi:AraC-like DNA-binding protein
MLPLDTLVFETPLVRAAKFRCGARDPRFRDSGPTANCAVVFPRTSVWIRHSGSRAFVADPSLATIYNPGQEYTRDAISSDGDRCEWFGVSTAVALEIAAAFDPHTSDRHEKPFIPQFAPVDRDLYLAQRSFFYRLERMAVDTLEAEETIIGLVSAVIRRGYEQLRSTVSIDNDAKADLVERTKASLAKDLSTSRSLKELSSELRVSPFHLCRVFREATGYTLHEFRTELRLRSALEMLAQDSASLSRVALEWGYSSHSHFTAAMRARFGKTPSDLRATFRFTAS